MSKILTTLNQLSDYKKIESDIDGVVLGVKDLSVNYSNTYTVEEIESFLKTFKKEVFLSVNKNMHKKDLSLLEKVLKTFDGKVNGFFYYDIAVVNFKQKLKLKTPLVWAQEHLTTNYSTMNYWYDFGANYSFVSAEITLEEIKEIKKHSKSKLIVPIFGRIPMFTSNRFLITNYHSYFQLDQKKGHFHLEKEGNQIPIEEYEEGTICYSPHYLNGLKESLLLKEIDYFYFNSYGIDIVTYQKIINNYKKATKENQDALEQEIDFLLEGNTDKGFLYKETVYKVKS